MILSIFEDSKGNIWFGSWCDGICKYDPHAYTKKDKKQFTYYTVENGIPGTEVIAFNNRQVNRGNAVNTIKEDQNGNIVISTLAGVASFDGKLFQPIQEEVKPLEITRSYDSKLDKWEEEFSHLWFGNINGNGVYKYDGDVLQPYTFPEPVEYFSGSSSQYATYSHHKDRDGNIWFGTEGGGIMRYNENGFTCINPKEEKGIVRCIFQDAAGKIWISNVLEGLYTYEHQPTLESEALFINFTKEMGYKTMKEVRTQNLSYDKMLDGIQTIAEEDNGVLWFGTFSNGLWRYDPSMPLGKGFTHFTEDNGIPNNAVKTIFKDSKGKLWFAIGRENTHVYHYENKSFNRIDM